MERWIARPLQVNVKTAAEMLAVPYSDIRKLIDAGMLQSTGSQSLLRITVSSIEALKAWRAQPDYVPPGFVYLVRLGQYHKIGIAKDVRSRIKSLQTGHPEEIQLVHSIPTNDMHRAEQQLHQQFADRRVRGEWFGLSDVEVLTICAYKALIF